LVNFWHVPDESAKMLHIPAIDLLACLIALLQVTHFEPLGGLL
jgi:hypothetical protein